MKEKVEIKQKVGDFLEKFNQPKYVSLALCLGMTLITTSGFCAAADAELESLTTTTIDMIFAPWIRKSALAFGGGWGIFQSVSSGSYKPLLTWGGLGLVVNYVPKLIDLVSKVGA